MSAWNHPDKIKTGYSEIIKTTWEDTHNASRSRLDPLSLPHSGWVGNPGTPGNLRFASQENWVTTMDLPSYRSCGYTGPKPGELLSHKPLFSRRLTALTQGRWSPLRLGIFSMPGLRGSKTATSPLLPTGCVLVQCLVQCLPYSPRGRSRWKAASATVQAMEKDKPWWGWSCQQWGLEAKDLSWPTCGSWRRQDPPLLSPSPALDTTYPVKLHRQN